MVGCRVGANAIRLHDEVVSLLARLFRSLRVDAIVEPMRIFAEASATGNNQRPDILRRVESVFTSQADFLTRQVATEGLSSNNSEADFQDLGHNADLYIFN